MIARAETFIANLNGWQRYAAALVAGMGMVLAMPPIGFFPAVFISIPVLMLLVATAPRARNAFMMGWVFGCGYFMVGLYWLAIAFKAFFSHAMWLLPVAVIGIPAYIALTYAVATALAWPFRRLRSHYALMFAMLLFFAEYVRGHFIMNFPWNLVGYSWHHVLPMLQFTAWYGIYGLTLMTLIWAATPLLSRRAAAVSMMLLFFVAGFGLMRLHLHPTVETPHLVRIVQPNITQAEKEKAENKHDIFQRHLRLSATQTEHDSKISFVVWPETAIDVFSAEEKRDLDRITLSLPENAVGLVGVNRMGTDGRPGPRNSLLALHPRSHRPIAEHDKFILAPWGEYIPYAHLLAQTPFGKYIASIQSLTPGRGPSTIKLGKDMPAFSPIICFEATFAGRMKDARRGQPDFLLFITNDAWSMGSPGPAQHFGFARVRAIEEGLPIVRASNTGISGIIDPYGRILQTLPLDTDGVLDAPLPERAKELPPYAFTGDDALLLLAVAILLNLLLGTYFFRARPHTKA